MAALQPLGREQRDLGALWGRAYGSTHAAGEVLLPWTGHVHEAAAG